MIITIELKLKQIRKERHMKLEGVSKISGIPTSTLSDIENGRTEPKLRQLVLISHAYGLTVCDLFVLKKEIRELGNSTIVNSVVIQCPY